MNSFLSKNLGLYVHIPFCHRKCFYCSFVVNIGQEKKIDIYLDCLAKEARQYQGSNISTIYLGGGTPTYLSGDQLKRLVRIIEENFKYRKGIEWTIEANPEGITLEKMKLIKNLGINRVSLGVQSLNNKYLKYLGRNHDSHLALQSLEIMRKADFDNVNVDFMYSFPNQTRDELEEDLRAMGKLDSEHISLYMLTIEGPSRFYAQEIQLKNDEIQAEEYLRVVEFLEEVNLKQYEISNFAKDGKESKHNLNYWRGGNYIGLGVGAHSHLDGKRFWNVSRLKEYIERVESTGRARENMEELQMDQRFIEKLLFGLRMNKGVDLEELQQEFGCGLDQGRTRWLEEFVGGKFLSRDNQKLKVTPKGRLVLDELCARLI